MYAQSAGVTMRQLFVTSCLKGLNPDTHNSAGVLHCCRASTRECGGSVLSAAVGAEPCSEKLRLQLASVGERFAGFKSSIAEDTRRRRLLEAERYRQIHQAVQAIETGVAAETRRRGEASKVLERAAGKMAAEMLERLQAKIGKHIGHLTREAAELMARCKAIRAAFETEVHSRNAREEAAADKLEELAKNLDFKIESEIAARHQQVSSIKKEIDMLLRKTVAFLFAAYPHCGMRLRGDEPREQFHSFVKEELEEVRVGLATAARAREEADDEILQAIHEYTNALQRGLQSIGGLTSGAAVA
ncbi:hypothetical protein, conserved [Eimeria brunetti]|uniref:SF-assemblin n=1 Tax=Eimeria brunetti TaxID=51314 RepID=U6LXM9_9EIME|nr:hypothetical protein, conserved [Eimeria brunetti]